MSLRNLQYSLALLCLTAAGCAKPSAETRLQLGLLQANTALVKGAVRDGMNIQLPLRYDEQASRQSSRADLKFAVVLSDAISHGDTPLGFAVQAGSVPVVQALLDAGAYPDYVSRTGGRAALHLAPAVDVARLLLDHKANVNVRTTLPNNDLPPQSTPLMFAVLEGKNQLVQLLLERGAEVNVRNSEGFTAFYYARPVRRELRKLLLRHGAKAKNVAWPAAKLAAHRKRIAEERERRWKAQDRVDSLRIEQQDRDLNALMSPKPE